jgi:hypothetical protein
MHGNIPGYPSNQVAAHLWSEGKHLLKVWNDTGGNILDGECYFLSYVKPTDSTNVPAADAMATSATIYRQIIVVANAEFGDGSVVADDTWGWVQIEGYCSKIKCAATIAIGDFLQGANASTEAADDGTTITTDSFGIATTAVGDPAAGHCAGILFGRMTFIG